MRPVEDYKIRGVGAEFAAEAQSAENRVGCTERIYIRLNALEEHAQEIEKLCVALDVKLYGPAVATNTAESPEAAGLLGACMHSIDYIDDVLSTVYKVLNRV